MASEISSLFITNLLIMATCIWLALEKAVFFSGPQGTKTEKLRWKELYFELMLNIYMFHNNPKMVDSEDMRIFTDPDFFLDYIAENSEIVVKNKKLRFFLPTIRLQSPLHFVFLTGLFCSFRCWFDSGSSRAFEAYF